MGHQGQESWYPECKICNAGNLGSNVICEDCYQKKIQALFLNEGEIEDLMKLTIKELQKKAKTNIPIPEKLLKVLATIIYEAQKEKLSK